MRGDLLDLALVVLAAAFAVSGYRQGFIVGSLSFIGFVGGSSVIKTPISASSLSITARKSLTSLELRRPDLTKRTICLVRPLVRDAS